MRDLKLSRATIRDSFVTCDTVPMKNIHGRKSYLLCNNNEYRGDERLYIFCTVEGGSYQHLVENTFSGSALNPQSESGELTSSCATMSMPYSFRGIIVPVLTAFNNDSKRSLNLSIIPQYADYLAKKGITGVLVNGTTGEGTSMSVAERKMVAEAWANAVKTTKQHLMIQVGGAPLPDVLELAKHAETIKANSILCLPELYFKPGSTQQLIEYLKLVSEAAPRTPLLYYHIPMFTNVNLHMGRLLESIGNQVPTFVGIKFTSNNLEEAAQAVYADNKKYVVFLGNDLILSGGCALGMDSMIGTSVNMFPELAQEILKAGKAGNGLKAKEKQEQLSKAVIAITKYGNWVESMKLAMSLLTNINAGPPRAPLNAPSATAAVSLANDLQKLGYRTTV